MLMRRNVLIAYWIVSVLIVALIIMMLVKDLSVSRALFVATMFLPGALAAQYMLPKISFKRKAEGIRNTVYLVLAIILLEYLLLIWTLCFQSFSYTRYIQGANYSFPFEFPEDTGVFNPLFISVVISGLAIGGSLIDRWLMRNHPEMENPITFCSDRKRVSLLPSQILYVESCDTEVFIHTSDGRKLRNKTGISQWESALGYPFVRIHRSFLVNGNYMTQVDSDCVLVGEESLPVSRKYQKKLQH